MVIRLIQSQSCCNFSVHAHVLTKVTDNGKTSFCLGLAHSSPHSAQAHVVSSDLPETIPKMLSQHWLRSFSFVECLALGRGRAGQHSAPPQPSFRTPSRPWEICELGGPISSGQSTFSIGHVGGGICTGKLEPLVYRLLCRGEPNRGTMAATCPALVLALGNAAFSHTYLSQASIPLLVPWVSVRG